MMFYSVYWSQAVWWRSRSCCRESVSVSKVRSVQRRRCERALVRAQRRECTEVPPGGGWVRVARAAGGRAPLLACLIAPPPPQRLRADRPARWHRPAGTPPLHDDRARALPVSELELDAAAAAAAAGTATKFSRSSSIDARTRARSPTSV